MNAVISFLIILCMFDFYAFASDAGGKPVLDKMYDDIIKSMPLSKRQVVESISKMNRNQNVPECKAGAIAENRSDSIDGNLPSLPDDLNRNLMKMIQQIDTMREKRIIHFMTVDPPSK
ncbi:MAG TPA: hypothetical protein VHP36_03140 [Chitinispirillaceae bacterium]|nr:hypothetical protein [Chitinispirillaceae bacterium]